jgi:hypothetical protein
MDVSRGDEERVKAFLIEQGLQPERFSKKERRSGHKTPDFRVFQGGKFCFFCEVKSIERDTWLDEQFDKAPVGTPVGGCRHDPTHNRLTDDIHTAVKQFDAVNPDLTHPNVLAFVNHEKMCGVFYLVGVITGRFLADDGEAYPIYLKYSQGRIRDEKTHIYLFIWLDEFESALYLLFTPSHKSHPWSLCTWFCIDPKALPTTGCLWLQLKPQAPRCG